MTRFKKIHVLIQEDLYNTLKDKNKFNSDWDSWIENLIKKQLKKEGGLI